MPGVALIWRASSRAMASVTSFSRLPVGAERAGILAAMAGIDRDDQRAHAGLRSCCIVLVAPGGGVVEAIGVGNAGGDVSVATVVAGEYVDAFVDAADGNVEMGLVDTPCAFGSVATRREVASAERAAVSCGVGSGLLAKAPIGSTTAGLTTAGTVSLVATALPSPGHSSTRRVTPSVVSMRGFRPTTGAARSNTMRTVPGTGWPVRTDLTTPAPSAAASAAQLGSRQVHDQAVRAGERQILYSAGRRAAVRRGCRWRPREGSGP